MTIGIDASRANKQNKTGVEWYSYHLIQELKKLSTVIPSGAEGEIEGSLLVYNKRDFSASSPTKNVGDSGRNDKYILYTNTALKNGLEKMLNSNWQEKILNWPPKYLWTQIRLWWELILNPPEVLLVPAHTIPFLPLPKKIKIYVTVHDVGFKRFPKLYKPIQFYYHDLTMRRIKNRADKIITISDFSKNEIIDLYQVQPEKIVVIPLGYDKEKYNNLSRHCEEALADEAISQNKMGLLRVARNDNKRDILEKYQITQPYLLYVGRLEKKKNIGNLIKALAYVKDSFLPLPEGEPQRGWENLKLVLAGNAGNEYENIKKIIAENKLEKEIILPGYIAEVDLPVIIKMAAAFVFTTLYEGFGLPILQAMAVGTPVVTSDLEPHRSVANGAAALADPQDPISIAKQINKILKDPEFANELRIRGLTRANEFSWEKTAKETLSLLISTT